MKILKICLILLLCPLVVFGQRIVFTPQWTAQSQFAGYYVAQKKGFYKEAGLDVEIQHPSTSYSALNRLLDGKCNMITMQLLSAMIQIDKGVQLVNILQTSQRNALMIVSRTDSIRTFQDLKGKKVGVWKTRFGDFGYIADSELELGICWIQFLEGPNLFISGAIDASLAMCYNEYLQIVASGHEDKPVIRFSETEYDCPEDGLYVTADFYRQNPKQVEAFAEASRRGWEYAHNHPEEAVDIVMEMVVQENVHTNRIHQRRMLEEIIKIQCAKGEAAPSFELNRQKVEKLSELLLMNNRIQKPISYEMLKGGEE